jgi:ribosomal protein S18 acetylase RimI-like enzyme
MKVAIEPAASGDVAAIERVVRDAYTPYIARMGKPPGPMLDDYAALVAEGRVWVLREEGEVVGALVLLPQSDHLLLDNVALAPSHHGKGLGRRLVAFAEEEAARQGFREIRLYTHETMHENIALYPRLGYAVTGRGEQAGYSRVFMRKTLEPPGGSSG